MHNDTTVCSIGVRLDRKHRIGPTFLRHALAASSQGDAHLPPHRQSACGSKDLVRDLGIEVDDALAIAEQVDVWNARAEQTCSARSLMAGSCTIADMSYHA